MMFRLNVKSPVNEFHLRHVLLQKKSQFLFDLIYTAGPYAPAQGRDAIRTGKRASA